MSYLIITVKVTFWLFAAGWIFSRLLKEPDRRWIEQRVVFILPAFYVAGLWLPSVWLLVALQFLTFLVVARNKAEAVALYPIVLLAAPGLSFPLRMGSVYIGAFDTWTIVGLGLLLAVLTKPGPVRVRRTGVDLAVLAFVMLSIFISIRGVNATSALRGAVGVVMIYGVPYLAVRRGIYQADDARRFMLVMIFAAATLAILSFNEARLYWPTYEQMYSHLGIDRGMSQAMKMRGGLMRAAASFPESTTFGAWLAVAFVTTYLMRASFRSTGAWSLALAMVFVGLLAAQARVGWLTLALAAVCAAVYRNRAAAAAAAAAGFAALFVTIRTAAGSVGQVADMVGTGGASAGTVDYRQHLFDRGIEEIQKHPLGVSQVAAQFNLGDLRQGEGIIDFVNAYIYYGVMAGIPGMIMFSCIIIYITAWLYRSRRQVSDNQNALMAGAVAFGWCSSVIITAFTSGFGGMLSIQFFVLVGVASSAAAVSGRRGTSVDRHTRYRGHLAESLA